LISLSAKNTGLKRWSCGTCNIPKARGQSCHGCICAMCN